MDDTLGAFVPGPMLHLDGAPTGPLRGLEFAAKDIYDVAGAVTGCGNPDWARTHEAAAETAWAIRTLLEAGASLAGKALTDELAYSLNGENYHFGTPTNVNAPGRPPARWLKDCGSGNRFQCRDRSRRAPSRGGEGHRRPRSNRMGGHDWHSASRSACRR